MISELSDELDIQPGHRVLEITDGPAETGPYDRILVTDPVTRVRWEWAEQWIWLADPGRDWRMDLLPV